MNIITSELGKSFIKSYSMGPVFHKPHSLIWNTNHVLSHLTTRGSENDLDNFLYA